ncbi:MAG: hypothetical protein QM704_06445 [Anaeromyxobacteraceae bacterium]
MTRLTFTAVVAALPLALVCGCSTDASGLGCPPGTFASGGRCVSSYTCGAGTHEEGGACVADAGATCGAGTHAEGFVCVPDEPDVVTCGAGTYLGPGNACLPYNPTTPVTCGAGTHLSGTTCVADTQITCGPGTHLDAGVCYPNPPASCGPGTHLSGAQCVPDAVLSCGAGTHLDVDRCVADATTTFELRVAGTSLTADGYSKFPVLVLGRNADGTPSNADVILWSSRPGSGTFTPSLFALGPFGRTVSFVPCSAASQGCTGPTEFLLALASAPDVVVAKVGPVQLTAPAGVGSAAPCLLGGNALYFDGSGYIFTGTQTVTDGAWSTPNSSASAVRLWLTPSQRSQGLWWDLEFSSTQLGQPLAAQVYEGAERAPFASPGHPGIDIGGDGRGCNTISGRFQIHELAWAGTALSRFTASFEQFCEQAPTNVLRGCVHYEAP